MHEKMISDFTSKKFFIFFLRHFSIERRWSYKTINNKLESKPKWELRIRFSIAWNYKGYNLIYFWQSYPEVEPFFAAWGVKE